jgi:hypothetical protein
VADHLRMEFAIVHPHQKVHPGQHLRMVVDNSCQCARSISSQIARNADAF